MIATASASELRTGGVEYWLTLDAERTGRVFSDFLPSVSSALLLYTGFKVAQFENQRWVRARSGGLRGTSLAFGLFVDLTGIVAMVFGYGWIVAYAFDTDWKQAVGLFAVAWLALS